ncbi:MAG: glycosyltransferase family 4 protein [Lachnospiraceae bacterium]|nr:glycosyltransferase family 4 protein [Lachnospiraceae bacterium]
MRIGIDLSFIRPDHKNGGTEAVMKNLIRGFEELKADGQEMDMVYFVHRDIYKDYVVMFPHLKYKVYDSKLPHALRTIVFQTFRLHRLLQEEGIDVLYFPTFQTGLRTQWKIPLVVNPHDIQYKYYPEYFSRLKRIYFQIFYGNALKKATSIVAISQYVKRSYEQHFKKQVKDKIRLMYNPIDFSHREEIVVDAVKDYENQYILCINSLTKHKNLITLVKAYDLLIKNNKSYKQDYRLVIGGAAWNGANELADYIKEHELEKYVILTGYLNDGQLTYLYNHARLFVTPSLYEGFGMTPIEAMAAGCPVISSKETSLYEVTKGLVRYYEPATDEKMLCQAMEEELQQDVQAVDKKASLLKNKSMVLCYDKKNVARKYYELFSEVLR